MQKFLILLTFSFFAVGCIAYTAVPEPTAVPLPPTTDAIWIDAAYLAEDLGISVEEAVQRTSGQDSIGFLNEALTTNEKETFGGLWLEHEPIYQVVIAFTENGETTLKPYLEIYPISAPITIRDVTLSHAELVTLQTAVSQQLSILDFPHSSSVNIMENQVEIFVTDEVMFNETLSSAGITLPEHVAVIAVYEPLQEPLTVTAVPNVFMPQLKMQSTTFMEALIVGNLEIIDGCLRIVTENESHLVIWQTDYFLTNNSGTFEIWDREAEVVATVGEAIEMGGGEGNRPQDTLLKDPLPDHCAGPYWFMGQMGD